MWQRLRMNPEWAWICPLMDWFSVCILSFNRLLTLGITAMKITFKALFGPALTPHLSLCVPTCFVDMAIWVRPPSPQNSEVGSSFLSNLPLLFLLCVAYTVLMWSSSSRRPHHSLSFASQIQLVFYMDDFSHAFFLQNPSSSFSPLYNGILLTHKKEQNCAICRDVDGSEDCHTVWSKSEREKQITYINTYM